MIANKSNKFSLVSEIYRNCLMKSNVIQSNNNFIEIVDNFLYFYAKNRNGISYDVMLQILSKAFDSMKM